MAAARARLSTGSRRVFAVMVISAHLHRPKSVLRRLSEVRLLDRMGYAPKCMGARPSDSYPVMSGITRRSQLSRDRVPPQQLVEAREIRVPYRRDPSKFECVPHEVLAEKLPLQRRQREQIA